MEDTFEWVATGMQLGGWSDWMESQPDNGWGGKQHCVAILPGQVGGSWDDQCCDGSFGAFNAYICEHAP